MSKNIVIDFGHGGRDSGALGKTTQEKNNNLTLGLKVGAILQRHNVNVHYTRTIDKDFCSGSFDVNTDLANRIAVAKQFNPNVFVSLHNNSFNKSAKGIETHCYKLGGTDQKLAENIQNQLTSLPFINRGIKVTNLYVTRKFDGTNTDACLVEYGFIDSEEDLILANVDKASVLIAKGILIHLGIKYVEENNNGDEDMLDVAILLNSKEDFYMGGYDVCVKNGFCGIFIRNNGVIPKEALSAKKLIIVGGTDITTHTNRKYISGNTKFDTAYAVGKYLG